MKKLFKLVFEGQELYVYTHDDKKIPCVGTTTITQTADDAKNGVHLAEFELTTDQSPTESERWSAHANLKCLRSVDGNEYDVESCQALEHIAGVTFIFKVTAYAEYSHALTSKS